MILFPPPLHKAGTLSGTYILDQFPLPVHRLHVIPRRFLHRQTIWETGNPNRLRSPIQLLLNLPDTRPLPELAVSGILILSIPEGMLLWKFFSFFLFPDCI